MSEIRTNATLRATSQNLKTVLAGWHPEGAALLKLVGCKNASCADRDKARNHRRFSAALRARNATAGPLCCHTLLRSAIACFLFRRAGNSSSAWKRPTYRSLAVVGAI